MHPFVVSAKSEPPQYCTTHMRTDHHIATRPDDVESRVNCYNSTQRALLNKHDPMEIKHVTDGHRRLAGTTRDVATSSIEPRNWSKVIVGCAMPSQRQPGACSLKRSVGCTSQNLQRSGFILLTCVSVIHELCGEW